MRVALACESLQRLCGGVWWPCSFMLGCVVFVCSFSVVCWCVVFSICFRGLLAWIAAFGDGGMVIFFPAALLA